MKKITFIINIFTLLISTFAYCKEYYVSKSGTDSYFCGDISNPCLTPEYAVKKLKSPGDILYLREGEYIIKTQNKPNQNAIIVPQADNCTISSYPGENATLIGDCGFGPGVPPTCGVIGSFDGKSARNYTTIANLTIKGLVVMMGTDITIENCDISVGGDGWLGTTQGAVIWLSWCTNCTIKNNKIHSNSAQANPNNNGLIMEYASHKCTIEYNDIFNSAGTGITLKDMPDKHVVRYNHIYNNNYSGIWTANQAPASGSEIYQNIFQNNNLKKDDESAGICLVIDHKNILIYNNLFHNNKVSNITKWTDSDSLTFELFNNIFISNNSYQISFPYHNSNILNSLLYCDYNLYLGKLQWKYRHQILNTFDAWKKTVQNFNPQFENHSKTGKAPFVNSNKTLKPNEFNKKELKITGRGNNYPLVTGPYIYGNETIGYSSYSIKTD